MRRDGRKKEGRQRRQDSPTPPITIFQHQQRNLQTGISSQITKKSDRQTLYHPTHNHSLVKKDFLRIAPPCDRPCFRDLMDHSCIMAPVPITPDHHHNPIPFLFESPQFVFYPSYPPVPEPRPKRALSPSQHLPPAKKRKLRAPPNNNLRPSCLSAPSVCPEVSKGFGLLTQLGSSRRPLSIVFAQANMGVNTMGGMAGGRGGLMALRKAAILNRIKREQMATRHLQQRQVEIARRQYRERLQLARRNPKRKVKKERTEEEKRVLRQFEKLDRDEGSDADMGDGSDLELDLDLEAQSCDSGEESASDVEMESGDESVAVPVVPIVPVVAEPEAVTKARRTKAAQTGSKPVKARRKLQPVPVSSRLAASGTTSTTSTTTTSTVTPEVTTIHPPTVRSKRSSSSASTPATRSRPRRAKSPESTEPTLTIPAPQIERGRRRTRSQSANPNPNPTPAPSTLFLQPQPRSKATPTFTTSEHEKENHTGVVITPSPSPSPPPLTTTPASAKPQSKESPLPAVTRIRREGLRSAKSMGSLKDIRENEFAPSGKGVGVNGGTATRKGKRTPFASCRRPPSPPNERLLEKERCKRVV